MRNDLGFSDMVGLGLKRTCLTMTDVVMLDDALKSHKGSSLSHTAYLSAVVAAATELTNKNQ
ncbi:hypothetical protein TUM17382_23880 [Shewanella algae]|nr:hypothetical protein TUM17382_23880 [Shewanella algae]